MPDYGSTCFDLNSGSDKEFEEYLNDSNNVVYGYKKHHQRNYMVNLTCGTRAKFIPIDSGVNEYGDEFYTISVNGNHARISPQHYSWIMDPTYQIFIFEESKIHNQLAEVDCYSKKSYFYPEPRMIALSPEPKKSKKSKKSKLYDSYTPSYSEVSYGTPGGMRYSIY